jgi:hypothetical protein
VRDRTIELLAVEFHARANFETAEGGQPYDFGIRLHTHRRASANPLAESQTARSNF